MVAYDASTGSQLWVKRYNGPANGVDQPEDVGVSPDGSAVFVTGGSNGSTSRDYATVAYDASTGAKLWAKLYNTQSNFNDVANALALSPDGSAVFVTGSTQDPSGIAVPEAATVAYAT